MMTILEKLVENISYECTDFQGQKIEIDRNYVQDKIGHLTKRSDLSKFIAEHLPFVKADNKTNRILKDLSPSTSMNFFLKFPILFLIII